MAGGGIAPPAVRRPAHGKHYRGTSLIRNNPPRRTLQKDYTQGPMVVLGGGAVSYERGAPVPHPAPWESPGTR